MTNLQEYWAGTDPLNPASAFRFERIALDSGLITLQFQAMSNRTYTVLCRLDLNSPVWGRITDVPARSTNHLVLFTDPAPGVSSRFYRLVIPAQPPAGYPQPTP